MEEVINLIAKRDEILEDQVKEFQKKLIDTHPKFKVGQVILFWGGYNNDIRYRSEITGFDENEGIYVMWDCYWFPIRDEELRDIE